MGFGTCIASPGATTHKRSTFSRRPLALDPTFARAHAGLSFTHFQNAFQHWADRDAGSRTRVPSCKSEHDG